MSREWRFYVADMREFCARVTEYTDGLSREDFEKTRLVYDATLRNLELIGEAARNVPEEVRAKALDIPWRRVIAVRNILIHGYLGIDNDVIWDIVQNEIGKLQRALEKLDS
ncbi:MAG: DUF86 domain-containing protein [Betaproteobacteria bacterium]